MNLVFRMIRVILAALLGARMDPMGTSVLTFRVLPNDLDANLHMNNGRYATIMDLGRIDLMLRAGLAGVLWRNRWNPVLGSVALRYRRSLAPFEKYRLKTRMLCWDSKWLYLEQTFETMDGKLAAVGIAKGVFLERGGRVVTTAQLLEAVGREVPAPPVPPEILAWQEAEQALSDRAKAA